MTPIGIAIGWLVSHAGALLVGIFQCISAGTFLYIATVEVIVEEFAVSRYRFTKYLCYLSSIVFVCGLWFIEQVTAH